MEEIVDTYQESPLNCSISVIIKNLAINHVRKKNMDGIFLLLVDASIKLVLSMILHPATKQTVYLHCCPLHFA